MNHDPMLDGIQRWSLGEIGTLNGSQYKMHPFNDGGYVLFADLPALIARVRADEREAAAGRVAALRPDDDDPYASAVWEIAVAQAWIDAAVAVVRGEQT